MVVAIDLHQGSTFVVWVYSLDGDCNRLQSVVVQGFPDTLAAMPSDSLSPRAMLLALAAMPQTSLLGYSYFQTPHPCRCTQA